MKKYTHVMYVLCRTLKLLLSVFPIMLIIIVLINILIGLSVPLRIYVWKKFVDDATFLFLQGERTLINSLYIDLALQLFVVLATNALEEVLNYLLNIYGSYLDLELTTKLLAKVEKFEMKDFDNSEIYNYIQKAMKESFQRSVGLLQTIIQIVQSIATVIGIIITLLSFSWIIIVLCVASTIPVFCINNKILEKWYEIYNKRFETIRFSNILKGICTRYENIKELKIYGTNIVLRDKINKILKTNIEQDKRIRKGFLIENVIVHDVDSTFLFFIKILVVGFSYMRKVSIGSLVAVFQSVDTLKSAVKNTLSMISQTYESALYMESFFYIMDYDISECKQFEFDRNFKKIVFEDVWFKYPNSDTYVIKGFSHTFFSNKTYGLVGLNGSGKTTLLKLLIGLYEPTKGKIYVDDVDISSIDKNSIYQSISAVFQDFIKYPLTIKENISMSQEETLDEDEMIKASKFSGAYEFIQNSPCGFTTKLQKEWQGGVELSIGQWQKIAIARGYIKESSSIMVLDEPTAAIDAVAEAQMFSNFKNLKNNRMCVIVTHRLSSIKLAWQILVMENGELIQFGTHDDLIKQGGKYKELFELQAEAYT